MPKVKDIMTKGIITVTEDANLFDIAELMSDYGISGMAVQDGSGSLEGMVTESDLVRTIAEVQEQDFRSITAGDMMTPVTMTADPDMDLADVCQLMEHEHVHRLVVTVDEKVEPAQVGRKFKQVPVGMITTKDVVRMIAGGK